MNDNKMTFVAIGGALLVVVVVMASLFIAGSGGDTPAVLLPQGGDPGTVSSDPAGQGAEQENDYPLVEVTAGNVKTVIEKTLSRPDSYYSRVEVRMYWRGGSSLTEAEIWRDGARSRIVLGRGDDDAKSIIISGEDIHIWYEGDTGYYSAKTYDLGSLAGLADDYLMIPTYEDILDIDDADIISAEYAEHDDYGGVGCIAVRAVQAALGYEIYYWISLDSGLLIAADAYEGNELAYSMRQTQYETISPDTESFILSDGTEVAR